MNNLEEVQLVAENEAEQQEELLREERRIIAERRRIRRLKARRRKAIQAGMLLAISIICILLCVNLLKHPDDVDYTSSYTYEKKNPASENSAQENNAEQEDSEEGTSSLTSADYRAIQFSKEENYERYDAYREANPDLSLDEVVWHVNAYLDKPKYQYNVSTGGYDDPYIIVNKYYTVPNGYEPPDLESFDGHKLRKETGEAYKKMRDAAKAQGLTIYVVSGYRSVEYQENLYNSYLKSDSQENVDRYSARAGHSEHHTGMALDLFGSIEGLRNFVKTPEYAWVKENCHKFGFIIRYTEETEFITGYEDEPWHLRYVGVKVSTDMKEKGITSFEEYHVKYLEETGV